MKLSKGEGEGGNETPWINHNQIITENIIERLYFTYQIQIQILQQEMLTY